MKFTRMRWRCLTGNCKSEQVTSLIRSDRSVWHAAVSAGIYVATVIQINVELLVTIPSFFVDRLRSLAIIPYCQKIDDNHGNSLTGDVWKMVQTTRRSTGYIVSAVKAVIIHIQRCYPKTPGNTVQTAGVIQQHFHLDLLGPLEA
jgi:hypothetical protein